MLEHLLWAVVSYRDLLVNEKKKKKKKKDQVDTIR